MFPEMVTSVYRLALAFISCALAKRINQMMDSAFTMIVAAVQARPRVELLRAAGVCGQHISSPAAAAAGIDCLGAVAWNTADKNDVNLTVHR